jgi:CO/xanthine dehydrogenase Mo-binding subunit
MNDVTMKGLSERPLKVVGTRPLRPDGVDKVTGRAKFGADIHVPNMLIGKVMRSPNARARIKSIDTSKARALPGVKAVITSADLADLPSEFIPAGEMMVNYRDTTRNVMAREKALYEGHAVAAVAAVSEAVAAQALKLIAVEYEAAARAGRCAGMGPARRCFTTLCTCGISRSRRSLNVAKRVEFARDAAVASLRTSVERVTTKPVHQGYIEPHACLASVSEDGQAELWCTTQDSHRAQLARSSRHGSREVAGDRLRDRRRFGGKTVVSSRSPCSCRARGPPGEDGDVAHRCVPRHRPDLRREGVGQDRCHSRRSDHGG